MRAHVHARRGIEESERELFELEDTDVNQIGCISGKVNVIRSRSYEEAHAQVRASDGSEVNHCLRAGVGGACARQCSWRRQLSRRAHAAPPNPRTRRTHARTWLPAHEF